MSKRAIFVLLGVFLFFMLLHIPANAGDIMSWEPRTFAGGGYAAYQDNLLNTAVAIEHGSKAVSGYYSYYNYAPYLVAEGMNSRIYYQSDEERALSEGGEE